MVYYRAYRCATRVEMRTAKSAYRLLPLNYRRPRRKYDKGILGNSSQVRSTPRRVSTRREKYSQAPRSDDNHPRGDMNTEPVTPLSVQYVRLNSSIIITLSNLSPPLIRQSPQICKGNHIDNLYNMYYSSALVR